MNHYELIVVSAFGRGEALATELQAKGFQVGFLDVSRPLGERSLPEIEGPFPIVRPNPLLSAHLEWLMNHSFEEIPNGLSLWLKNGPFEFRGGLAPYYQASNKAMAFYREMADESKRSEATRKLNTMSFDDTWPLQFAHGFAANELRRSTECHFNEGFFPLQQALHKPIFSPDVVEKIQSDAQSAGVEFIKVDKVNDVQADKAGMTGIEISAGQTRALTARYWVWCLSSEETASLSRRVAQKLFAKVITADWAWRRFQMHSSRSILTEIVPAYVVMIEDLHFPWAYDNLVVLKRRSNELTDLWVRLPNESSQKPETLKKFTTKLEDRLRQRFAGHAVEIETPWTAGAPLFPVFEPETLRQFQPPVFRNLIYEGAEVLPRLDWGGRFQVQAASQGVLQTMKINDAAKLKKEDNRDQALHAP